MLEVFLAVIVLACCRDLGGKIATAFVSALCAISSCEVHWQLKIVENCIVEWTKRSDMRVVASCFFCKITLGSKDLSI